jgi:predicted HicB family RNase H-like nuclease
MKNVLRYKGFLGTAEFSDEDEVFFGKIIGIHDLVTFEGASVKDLKNEFRQAVDEYTDLCKRHNKPLSKSMTGNFNVRINPDLHHAASQLAAEKGISLNKYVQDAIQSAVEDAEAPYVNTGKKRKQAS